MSKELNFISRDLSKEVFILIFRCILPRLYLLGMKTSEQAGACVSRSPAGRGGSVSARTGG